MNAIDVRRHADETKIKVHEEELRKAKNDAEREVARRAEVYAQALNSEHEVNVAELNSEHDAKMAKLKEEKLQAESAAQAELARLEAAVQAEREKAQANRESDAKEEKKQRCAHYMHTCVKAAMRPPRRFAFAAVRGRLFPVVDFGAYFLLVCVQGGHGAGGE